ncbi:CMRF35-like molecule 1 isoform X1 [Delphinapterus leucas]|uniref:CMRF35-like molecule 1 isoform X1 n=1 Tax=Delphinapterus leucas TaxID=9749 RepID=A0A2Y9PHZ0_DELLE|nr:CMRF35-like molecule 1 isoform X1 [Delphinapterus leucas]XP_022445411.1 CMRF35-like molecule 1 isoform X1 [Delphinapterus leucas]
MHLLLLFYLLRRLAGSSSITGPKAVSSLERGSLTVQCRYSPGWEKHVKWWCRGAAWSSCEFVVKTTEPEKEVKKDRVSIRDNRKNRTIAVTMEKLRLNDADTYWCGIERFGTDLGVQVKVTIDPAPTAVPATTPATSSINTFTVPVSLEQTSDSLAVTSPGSNSGSVFLKTSILLPFISAVLLLLLMVASLVVWRMMKQQKKAAGISPEQVLQPEEGDICYTNLSLQQTENSGSSRKMASTRSSSPAQANVEEVDYVTMVSFLKEDIARTALSLETSDQEPTYSNMGHLITRIPSRSHEEPTEYSAIKKP